LTQRRDTQPASILLVDDDEDALLLLKRMLSSNDYEVLIATSARQALRLLSEHNVKVVVSDQQMPGMSGVDFLQRVKSLFPDTVRVMLSGHTEFSTVSDAINKGEIFRFLAKSWDKEQLRRDIREAFDVAVSGRGKLISIKGGRPTAA
ncbi:MAG TPA: response regulator, partial [Burkholderiales bacterium]|nr:response regulator [Burkholderiales bacterium]